MTLCAPFGTPYIMRQVAATQQDRHYGPPVSCMQLISWKDLSPKLCVEWDVKPYTLTMLEFYLTYQCDLR